MLIFKWLILLLLYIFVIKIILRVLLCNNTFLHNFIFYKFEMYMELKLNWTYIVEDKNCEILLKTTKKHFFLKRSYNILYMQNSFIVKILFEFFFEIHKVG